MKNFLIFYPQLDKPLAGGPVIDFAFINQIKESGEFSISYFLDKDLKCPSILSYNLYLLFHFRQFMGYDIIFMGSRSYPKMLLFVKVLRLFGYKGKLITYHHHYNYETNKGWRKVVHKQTELAFLKSMTEIIIPSPFVLDLTRKIIPSAKTVYIPIGFNVNHNLISDNSLERVVFVGTIERRKRIHHIIEIAYLLKDKLPNLKFDVVGRIGENDYYSEIMEKFESFNLKNIVTLYGRVDDEKLSSIYSKASLFVFPSSYEGYGMVLIEAMGFGLPVVAYNNSAIPYTVKDDYNGILIKDGDYRQMANSIYNLLNDSERLKELKKNALKYVQDLPTAEEMKRQMADYIAGLAH